MFSRLPQPTVGGRGLTGLEGAPLLQQCFLRMKSESPTGSWPGRHTLWPQGTEDTDGSVKAEVPCGAHHGHHGPVFSRCVSPVLRDRCRRVGPDKSQILLGEAAAVGPVRHLGAQRAGVVRKCLAEAAVPLGGIGNHFGHWQACVLITLVDQGQGTPRFRHIDGQDGHGLFQLAFGVLRHRGLVAIKARAAQADFAPDSPVCGLRLRQQTIRAGHHAC